ncbi:hypothetical protein BLNAU_16856 [Blattamonas nauphoetae]|uniref:Uncharacterized protein n=1 Tax=Blattamonas nauphoetae TaxID=2049346 RepID=A0ABQ9XC52_9EUKA|nr:hypothetical protein BLNAU_16856 [Blattamonas nauphoetae]
MAVAGSVWKAFWKERKGREPANADSQPLVLDCSAFLNWNEEELYLVEEWAIIFRSLVATLKIQPALDDSLEANAVKILNFVDPEDNDHAAEYLDSLGGPSDESLTNFVQFMVVLISSPSQTIPAAALDMLNCLILWCSPKSLLALVQADLIPQLIITLNPISLSFTKTEYIHQTVIYLIHNSFLFATPFGLLRLEIKDVNKQQAVCETVLQQVLVPSEKYICHLCVNRLSIVDGELCEKFLSLLTRLLQICPYYQPTMDCILHMPVVLTIPSCLTFVEHDRSIGSFLLSMIDIQQKCNIARGQVRQIWKTVHRMLRMKGMEEVIEQKLRNDKNESYGGWIVGDSIEWNNQQGTNLPQLELKET